MPFSYPHLLFLIVFTTTLQYVHTYIIHRFPDGTGFRYPSIVSKIGQPISNAQSALLFVAPLDNINLCEPDFSNTRILHYPRSQYFPSSAFENTTDISLSLPVKQRLKATHTPEKRHLQSSDSLPLALYIMRGRCTIAEKARNAMLLNDKYHSIYGGPSIKYLIIVNDAPYEDIDRDDIDTVAVPPINFHIVYLSLNGGKHLFDLVNKNIKGNDGYHLTESTFYPMDNEENNDFTFKISIDEIYLTSDIHATNWRLIIGLIVGAVLILVLFCFLYAYKRYHVGNRSAEPQLQNDDDFADNGLELIPEADVSNTPSSKNCPNRSHDKASQLYRHVDAPQDDINGNESCIDEESNTGTEINN